MIALWLLAGYVALAFITWALFCAVMMLKLRRTGLQQPAKALGYTILWLGYLSDAAFNLASSVLFLDVPQELLFTDRVKRLKQTTGWRKSLADWFDAALLDPIDPGHCKP